MTLVVDEIGRSPEASGRIALRLPDAKVWSDIDPDALAIAVRNLVENGLKHGASGGTVAVALSADGDLTVSNDGPPLPPDLLERLLRPFERGRTAADGTGLGLAIASAIASGVGGTLVLSSPVPGEASGFQARFRVPVLPLPASGGTTASPP